MPSIGVAQERLALVIGNAAYGESRLATPVNNAMLVRAALFDLGYQVSFERDAGPEALRAAIQRFGERLKESRNSLGLFYYSGLAVQSQGANYLLADAVPARESELRQKAINLQDVVTAMQQGDSRGRIVIVDASSRKILPILAELRPGLAQMRVPPGFLLAFSAQPDQLAQPPTDSYSYYAQALGNALRMPGLPVEVLFSRVHRQVGERTGQQQQTWYDSALTRLLFLHPTADSPGVEADSAAADRQLWQSIQGRVSTVGLEEYLTRFPRGTYADEARRRLRAQIPAAVNLLGPGTSFRDCPQCPELVVVDARSFEMGSSAGRDNEQPVHRVTMSRMFAVGRYEVTFEEWDACVADGGCSFQPPDKEWGRGRRPVIFVSWQDAVAYLQWLSRKTGERYRLPTEAEWEGMARAGGRGEYPWGDEIGSGRANCFGCQPLEGEEMTRPVGSYPANAYGLFDVVGNVWEWTEDCYVDSYEAAPRDGGAQRGGDCTYRVFRGGSWHDEPARARVGFRNGGLPTLRSVYVGFRVLRALP